MNKKKFYKLLDQFCLLSNELSHQASLADKAGDTVQSMVLADCAGAVRCALVSFDCPEVKGKGKDGTQRKSSG